MGGDRGEREKQTNCTWKGANCVGSVRVHPMLRKGLERVGLGKKRVIVGRRR